MEVLHQGLPGDDHLHGLVGSEAAHRSEQVFELAVICFDQIVRVPLDVMPRRRTTGHDWIESTRFYLHLAGDWLASRCLAVAL